MDTEILNEHLYEEPESSMHKLKLTGPCDCVFLFSEVMFGRCFKVSAGLSIARVPATILGIAKLAVVY